MMIIRQFTICDAAGSTMRSEFKIKMAAKQFDYSNKCLKLFQVT